MILLPFILAAAAQSASATEPQPAEKIICRREEVTGSLAGGHKTCHTAEEWRKIADIAARNAQQMVDHGNIGCGKCDGG